MKKKEQCELESNSIVPFSFGSYKEIIPRDDITVLYSYFISFRYVNAGNLEMHGYSSTKLQWFAMLLKASAHALKPERIVLGVGKITSPQL